MEKNTLGELEGYQSENSDLVPELFPCYCDANASSGTGDVRG